MPDVKWIVSVQAGGGTIASEPFLIAGVEALDTVEVVIPPSSDKRTEVDIQPGIASAIHLLLIKAGSYPEEPKELRYQASSGDSNDSKDLVLDAPHVYTGGSIALFNIDSPKKLKFLNKSEKAITVHIYVARHAVVSNP